MDMEVFSGTKRVEVWLQLGGGDSWHSTVSGAFAISEN